MVPFSDVFPLFRRHEIDYLKDIVGAPVNSRSTQVLWKPERPQQSEIRPHFSYVMMYSYDVILTDSRCSIADEASSYTSTNNLRRPIHKVSLISTKLAS